MTARSASVQKRFWHRAIGFSVASRRGSGRGDHQEFEEYIERNLTEHDEEKR
jgi:hypothetical protein